MRDRGLSDFGRLFDGSAAGGSSDDELLGRFRERGEGADAAFTALVDRHGPAVMGICRRVLRDPNDADDAFQATFLILSERSGSLRDRAVLGGWLARVALRIALRIRRQAGRRREVERRPSVGRPPDGPEAVPLDVIQSAIDEEVDRLPEPFRLPVVLCHLEGLTHDEAARRLGCPVGTVRSRLARARQRLGKQLARRGFGPVGVPSLAPMFVPWKLIGQASRAALQPSTASARVMILKKGWWMTMIFDRWWRLGRIAAVSGAAAGAVALAGSTAMPVPATPAEQDRGKPRSEGSAVDPIHDPVVSLAIGADGSRVAALRRNGTVLILDPTAGRHALTISNDGLPIESMAVSPDGLTIAGSARDNVLRSWDTHSGEITQTFSLTFADAWLRPTSMAFSPDGKAIAVSGRARLAKKADGSTLPDLFEVRQFDVATGRVVWARMGRREDAFALAYSPDGRSLAIAGRSTVRLWDATTGEPGPIMNVPNDAYTLRLAFSPDGSTLYGSGSFAVDRRSKGQVTAWDPRSGNVIRTLEAPGATTSLAFSPNGKVVVAAGDGPTREFKTPEGIEGGRLLSETRAWDVASGARLWSSEGEWAGVTSVAFSPDGKALIRSDADGVVAIDPANGRILRTLVKTPGVSLGLPRATRVGP